MSPTSLGQGEVAEHAADRLVQRLGAVDHQQQPTRRVQAPVGEVGQQPGGHRGVLGGALDHPQRHLRPVGGDPQCADELVLPEAEPVDEHHQPPAVSQRLGVQLSEPLGGGGDELARHRRLRRALGLARGVLVDRLEPRGVAARGQPGEHRPDHVLGQQVGIGEGAVGLQLDLAALDAAHPRPLDAHPPAAERDRACLGAVTVNSALGVVTALLTGELGDLGVHQLAHHLQTDRRGGRQQPLAHVLSEPLEVAIDSAGQLLGQTPLGA